MGAAGLILFAGLLIAAAASDLARYRIPNALTAALALCAIVVGLPHDLAEAGWRAASFALVGGVATGLFVLGLMGGGDVKLLAAAALWMPLPTLPIFLVALALAGALQAGVVLTARAVAAPAPSAPRPRMPYGVSIALAGLVWAAAQAAVR
jgi:prepilin peptidase CpaA